MGIALVSQQERVLCDDVLCETYDRAVCAPVNVQTVRMSTGAMILRCCVSPIKRIDADPPFKYAPSAQGGALSETSSETHM